MDTGFWRQRWREGRIGFHEGVVNRLLQRHWARLSPAAGETVLVPLCGKSRDLAWLAAAGHPVVGVELAPEACRDFFAECKRVPEVMRAGPFVRYRGRVGKSEVTLWCGDLLTRDAAQAGVASLWYDRAALVALPAAMRRDYVAALMRLLAPGARGLLVTLEDASHAASEGPPFPVPEATVRALFEPHCRVQRLQHDALPPGDRLHARSGAPTVEAVYALWRR